ncbi:hypothetical protein JCM11641_001398 [Rhodosporidiobolus odoratus]
MAAQEQQYYIGVDVGTGSARAALVSSKGDVVAESTYATKTWRDEKNKDIFEQSSAQIWNCISSACKDVLRESKISPSQVKGIGFDATCSLVVAKLEDGTPVCVSPGSWESSEVKEGDLQDVILWADHRAHAEARKINSTKSKWLNYVGKTISLEMEVPKMLWLKNNMPASLFSQLMFFDLPDWLSYRATDDLARSNCSLACKCSYVPPGVEGSKGWNDEFFEEIGLEEFVKNEFIQVGGVPGKNGLILTAGQPVGAGLSKRAAEELGLLEGTAVGSAVIDAYAGWVGTVAAPMEGQDHTNLSDSRNRLAAIAGTSTCHIVQSEDPVFVPGVWGPYKHAVYPGYWMNEGGQSSTGQLLDFMVETHPAYPKLLELAKAKGTNHFVLLTEMLEEMVKEKKAPFMSWLTRDMYLYPDLHGNRSPLADVDMRGMLIGMQLDKTVGDLALRYYATGEAIALQTRQIIDEMNAKGHKITSIFMSGGLVKNRFLMSLIADICNMPIQLPYSHSASVVIGSAMLGAAAFEEKERLQNSAISTQDVAEQSSFGMKERLWEVMTRMSRPGTTVRPSASEAELKLLAVKYDIFKECIDLQRKWRSKQDLFMTDAPLKIRGTEEHATFVKEYPKEHPRRPRPVSPRSIFYIARDLELPKLEELALWELKKQMTVEIAVIDPKEAGTIAHLFRLHGVHIGGTLGHDGRHVKWTNRSLTAAQVANGSVATSTTRTDRPLRFKVRPNGGEHNIHLHLVFYPLRSVQANIEPLLPLMYTPKEPPPKPFASLVPLFSSISLDPPNLAIVLPSSQYVDDESDAEEVDVIVERQPAVHRQQVADGEEEPPAKHEEDAPARERAPDPPADKPFGGRVLEIPFCRLTTVHSLATHLNSRDDLEFAPIKSVDPNHYNRFIKDFKTTKPGWPLPVSPRLMYRLAFRLGLEEIQKLALDEWKKQLTPALVAQLLLHPDTHHLPAVRTMLLDYITKNASMVWNSRPWKEMAKKDLDDEDEVLFAKAAKAIAKNGGYLT